LADVAPDIVINNAGVGRGFDRLVNTELEDIERVIQTNVTGALHVLRATMPGMIERDRGHIVNIGSVSGLYPSTSALYGASKGAIHLLQQNLRLELKGTRVRCTEICPGRVHTEFYRHALDDSAASEKMYQGFEVMQPQDIAAAIAYAIDAPWRVNVNNIELAPTEQHFGGAQIVPSKRRPQAD
jgi:NADP-dependent 3-hydroxy acid dehydrogenase YdfG